MYIDCSKNTPLWRLVELMVCAYSSCEELCGFMIGLGPPLDVELELCEVSQFWITSLRFSKDLNKSITG